MGGLLEGRPDEENRHPEGKMRRGRAKLLKQDEGRQGDVGYTWRQWRRRAQRMSPQEGPGGECWAVVWPYVDR